MHRTIRFATYDDIPAISYLVGRLLRLQRAKSVALSIEVGMQNSGLATSLAVMHFAAFPLATIPGVVFSVWHNISGAIIARIYSRNNGSSQRHDYDFHLRHSRSD